MATLVIMSEIWEYSVDNFVDKVVDRAGGACSSIEPTQFPEPARPSLAEMIQMKGVAWLIVRSAQY